MKMQLLVPMGGTSPVLLSYLERIRRIVEPQPYTPKPRSPHHVMAATTDVADASLESDGSTGADGSDGSGSGDDDDGDGDGDPDWRRSPHSSHTCSTRQSAPSHPHSRSSSSGASNNTLKKLTPSRRRSRHDARYRRRDWMAYTLVLTTIAVGLYLAHSGQTVLGWVTLTSGLRAAFQAFTDA